jgi:hypothetical protein
VEQLWTGLGPYVTGALHVAFVYFVLVALAALVAVFGSDRYARRARWVLLVLRAKRKALSPPSVDPDDSARPNAEAEPIAAPRGGSDLDVSKGERPAAHRLPSVSAVGVNIMRGEKHPPGRDATQRQV